MHVNQWNKFNSNEVINERLTVKSQMEEFMVEIDLCNIDYLAHINMYDYKSNY